MLFADYDDDDDVKKDKCIRPVVHTCGMHVCSFMHFSCCSSSSLVFLDSDVHRHSMQNHLEESAKYWNLDEFRVVTVPLMCLSER